MDLKAEPRRRNAALTKARILDAARACFAELGYARTGLRDIADRAEVSSSLPVRYFGSKAALFEQALIDTIARNSIFTTDRRRFGETMAQLTLDRSSLKITAMLVLALADPETRETAQRVARRHMIEPLAEWLGPPHALERALELFAVLTGFVVQMDAMAPDPVPAASVAWYARALQAIVDGRA